MKVLELVAKPAPPAPPHEPQKTREEWMQEFFNLPPIPKSPERLAYEAALEQYRAEYTAWEMLPDVVEVDEYVPAPRGPVSNIFDHLVLGENAPAFRLIETLVNVVRREPGTAHHFGLFGPASCGKTTTAEIIAATLERPYFGADAGFFNAKAGLPGILSAIEKALGAQTWGDLSSQRYFADEDALYATWLLKPAVLFIDEAHELNASTQNVLLSVMEKPYRTQFEDKDLRWRDVSIILATTDASQLVKPLRTRTHEVVFESYSPETVAGIVEKCAGYTGDLARRIALAAKLIPRRALQIARVLDPQDPEETLRQLYAIDEDGFDSRDRKILEILAASVTHPDIIKIAHARNIIEMADAGKQVSATQLAKAKAITEHLKPIAKPIGLANLADRLGLTDQRDLQDRVNALVNRGYALRTPRGIVATNLRLHAD